MGVSGAGKTTVGRRLADRMDGVFIDGDDLHPDTNIVKMKSGVPLTDDDRWPWLDRIVDGVLKEESDRPVIVACSALKASYRQRLCQIPYRLVYLQGQEEDIKTRLQNRPDHFMPAKLLTSQYQDLEEPKDALVVPVTWTVDHIVDHIINNISTP